MEVEKNIQNTYIQEGMKEFADLEKTANEVAEDVSSNLVESIVKNSDKYNITTAILTVAKSMSHLASYLYDTEEEFLSDVKKAREAVVSSIIPSLLDPQPCGLCEECKNGNPEGCIKPRVRGDRTTSRFLPILCNMIIEYDLFNKICYMHSQADPEVPKARGTDREEEPEAQTGGTRQEVVPEAEHEAVPEGRT